MLISKYYAHQTTASGCLMLILSTSCLTEKKCSIYKTMDIGLKTNFNNKRINYVIIRSCLSNEKSCHEKSASHMHRRRECKGQSFGPPGHFRAPGWITTPMPICLYVQY